MRERVRRSLEITIATAVTLLACAVWAPKAHAYARWSDGCDDCHGDFNSGTYSSLSNGTSWGTNLMAGHNTMVSSACNVCHQPPSGTPRTPVYIGLSAGITGYDPISCLGCHGRAQDATGSCVEGTLTTIDPANCGMGAGLRQHHATAGTAVCADCHGDGVPVGENVPPPYYFTPDATHPNKPIDPCNAAPSPGNENKYGLTGLDNDGDDAYDGDDPDCATAPTATATATAIELTPTGTPTQTATASTTVTTTASPTGTASATRTGTPTQTATVSTPVSTASPTGTASATRTGTPTQTATVSTPVSTASPSPTSSAPATDTPSPTLTATTTAITAPPSPTSTATVSATSTEPSTPTPTEPATPTGTAGPTCAGDCNDDTEVRINELILGVNIALESAELSDCPSFDTNDNEKVDINELIGAVNNALDGCPET